MPADVLILDRMIHFDNELTHNEHKIRRDWKDADCQVLGRHDCISGVSVLGIGYDVNPAGRLHVGGNVRPSVGI